MISKSSKTRQRRRWVHGVVIVALTGVTWAISGVLLPDRATGRSVLSVATAYASLGFLMLTLMIGPWKVLTGQPNPVSQDLRRDIGIGAATLAVTHVVLSLGNHFSGRISRYFFDSSKLSLGTVRTGAFGIGVWTGVAATLVVAALVLTSNDRSLRRLARRWKSLQRFNYLLAVLTVAHTVAFWIATGRALSFVIAGSGVTAGAAMFQAFGYLRRSRPLPATSSM